MFGQSQGFGQQTQGTSLFGGGGAGGQSQGFGGQQTGFGGGMQPQQTTSMFGGQQATPSTGGFGQAAAAPGTGIGQGGGVFGQQQTSAFTASNPQTQGFAQGQTGASTGFGGFTQGAAAPTQNQGAFGGGFGQQKPPGQGGMFGGQSQTQGIFGQQQQQQQQQTNPSQGGFGQGGMQGGGFNQGGQSGSSIFVTQTQPQLTSMNTQFTELKQQQKDLAKATNQSLVFKNIRVLDKNFGNASSDMLRLADYKARQFNQPQEHPEHKASQVWQSQQGNYNQQILQKYFQTVKPEGMQGVGQQAQQPGTGGGMYGGQQQPGGLFQGGNQQNTGAFSQGSFGQQTQQQTTGMFSATQGFQSQTQLGGQQSNPGFGGQTTGMFAGATKPQGQTVQTTLGFQSAGNTLQANPSSGGGIFQQKTQQQTQGLFPATGQQTQGSLFNQGGQSNQPTGGTSLFNPSGQQTQQQTQPGAGLFGPSTTQTNPAASTGLFAPKPATQSGIGQGLFNNPSAPSGGNSLFPSVSGGQATSGTGLFAPKPASGGTSLFPGTAGTNPPANTGQSSMFPTSGTQQPGSLFNPQANPANPTQPSNLFPSSNPQPGNSLFSSGQPAPAPQQSGLFPNAQTTQQTGAGFPTSQAFASAAQFNPQQQAYVGAQMIPDIHSEQSDPLGLGGFTVQNDQTAKTADEELADIKRAIERFQEESQRQKQQEQSSAFGNTGRSWAPTPFNFMPYDREYEEMENRRRMKEQLKMRNAQNQSMVQPPGFHPTPTSNPFSAAGNSFTPRPTGFAGQLNTRNQTTLRQSIGQPSNSDQIDSSPQKQDSALIESTFIHGRANVPEGLVKVTIKIDSDVLTSYEDSRKTKVFTYHKTRLVEEMVNQATEWFCEILQKPKLDEDDEVRFEYRCASLNLKKTLEQEDITGELPVTLVHMKSIPELQKPRDSSSSKVTIQSQIEQLEVPCPPDLLPKPPKEGYFTRPSMNDMSKMTLRQLKRLPCFDIWNANGKIHFFKHAGTDGVDITEVDLEKVVTIGKRDIEVYYQPGEGELDQERAIVTKPAIGCKLNVRSQVTLNRLEPVQGKSPAQQEARLKKALSRQSAQNAEASDPNGVAEHISYCHQSFEWVFRVPHYTKWSADDDTESEKSLQIDTNKPFNFSQAQIDSKEATLNTQFENKTPDQRRIIHPSNQVYKEPRLIKTDAMLEREQRFRDLQSKLSGKEFYAKYDALPQEQQNASFIRQYREVQGTASSSYLNRGFKPVWRPVQMGEYGSSLQIVSAHQSVQAKRTKFDLQIQEVDVQGSTYNYSKLIESILTHSKVWQGDLPSIQMHKNNSQVTDFLFQICKDLSEGIALEYQKKMLHHQNEGKLKVMNEHFCVVCLLNILYGDPRVPLARFHPMISGTDQICSKLDKLKQTLQSYQATDDFEHFLLQKRAITQLLSLMCKIENVIPQQTANQPQQKALECALDLVKNGEIARAVKCLSLHGMTKMSLLLSNCLQMSPFAKQQMKQVAVKATQPGSIDGEILDIITGGKTSGSLYQQMLQRMIFGNGDFTNVEELDCEGVAFFEVLSNFKSTLKTGNWKVQGYKIQNESKDYFITWLVAIIEKLAISRSQQNAASQEFDQVCSQLCDQMLLEQDLDGGNQIQRALLFACFIDDQEAKRSVLRNTVDKVELLLRSQKGTQLEKSIDQFMHQTLMISGDFAKLAVSRRALEKGDYPRVIMNYIELDMSPAINLPLASAAHFLFKTHIVSAYFSSIESINKILVKKSNLPGFNRFRKSQERKLLDQVMEALAAKSMSINDYDSGVGLYNKIIEALDAWMAYVVQMDETNQKNAAGKVDLALQTIEQQKKHDSCQEISYIYLKKIQEELVKLNKIQ